jgi:hypothetical protein
MADHPKFEGTAELQLVVGADVAGIYGALKAGMAEEAIMKGMAL